MAQDLAKLAATTVARPQKGEMKDVRKSVRASFAKLIDVAALEKKTRRPVNPGVFRRMIADDNFVLEIANAQREIALRRGQAGTAADLVGTPARGTFFREVLGGLLGKAVATGMTQIELVCSLRPGHPDLAALDDAINGGLNEIADQEGLDYDMPTFRAIGVGLDQGRLGGHDPEVIAAFKALVEAERAALAPPAQS